MKGCAYKTWLGQIIWFADELPTDKFGIPILSDEDAPAHWDGLERFKDFDIDITEN